MRSGFRLSRVCTKPKGSQPPILLRALDVIPLGVAQQWRAVPDEPLCLTSTHLSASVSVEPCTEVNDM